MRVKELADVRQRAIPHGSQMVDVKDMALLHVASVLDPNVRGSRLQSWEFTAGWNDLGAPCEGSGQTRPSCLTSTTLPTSAL